MRFILTNVLSFILLFSESSLQAQSVDELNRVYSGVFSFDKDAGILKFNTSGAIDFRREKEMSGIWEVPGEVKRLVIGKDVRVTGQFTFRHNAVIEGEDRETSVIYGTDTPELLHGKGLDGGGNCIPYSSILGYGKITLRIYNLTTLNPVSYMWTGRNGCVLHLDGVRGIDNRKGWHNHSDGISGARGTTLKNCYLETGDDAIKLYADITVEDTVIKMRQNTVPVQLGWGSYGSGAKGVFRNVTIEGETGRDRPPAVIVGRYGAYRKFIEMHNVKITNPNAALVSLYAEGMELDLKITAGDIRLKQFMGEEKGRCSSMINGKPGNEFFN